jgi:hypothetical protein
MLTALSEMRPNRAPILDITAEKIEFVKAVKAGRVYDLSFMEYLAIPGTNENDELLGDLCLLKSLCDRDGYRIKGYCTLDRGPCPPVETKRVDCTFIGWEFLPSPERFWIRDDFDRLNPVPVDGKLARVLREAFNEQLLGQFNARRLIGAILPLPVGCVPRLNPEMEDA